MAELCIFKLQHLRYSISKFVKIIFTKTLAVGYKYKVIGIPFRNPTSASVVEPITGMFVWLLVFTSNLGVFFTSKVKELTYL